MQESSGTVISVAMGDEFAVDVETFWKDQLLSLGRPTESKTAWLSTVNLIMPIVRQLFAFGR